MLLGSRSRALAVLPALVVLLAPAAAQAAPADFISAGQTPLGNTPYDVITADLDGDGVPDAVAPNANGHTVSVLLGDGDGTFTEAPESPFAVGQGPRSVTAADFNGDGRRDLAVSETSSDRVAIFRGDGDGTFTAGPTIAVADPWGIAAGNLNGDGDPDLAVVTYAEQGALSVLLGGTGAGFSVAPTSPELTGGWSADVVIGNFDGNGGDVAVTNAEESNPPGSVSILLGAGGGDLTPAATSPETVEGGPYKLAAADLDGTAPDDLAVGNESTGSISILLGGATADFIQPPSSPESTGGRAIAAADFDGDDATDLASFEGVDTAVVLLNDGDADFAATAQQIPLPAFAADITVADTDGDGDQDLLAVGGNVLTSLLNDEPDSDSDGLPDVADECPELSHPEGCPTLDRQVKLRYAKRRGRFTGKLTSSEASCVADEKVRLLRRRPAGDDVLKATRTNSLGRFAIRRPVKRGRYVARAPRSVEPASGVCPQAESPVVRP